jgi:hypothetical protein
MQSHVTNDPEADVSSLIAGIMDDARHLLIQHLTLFQIEVKNDINQAASGFARMIAGAVMILAAMILLEFASAYLLCALVPELPLWAALAIVGGLAAPIGVWLVLSGKTTFDHFRLPDKTAQALKEDIEWKTKT